MYLRKRLAAAWNALLDRPPTRDQVMRCAHALGMHHKTVEIDCDYCFEEAFEAYMAICIEVLVATDHVDECLSFRAHLRQVANYISGDRIMLFHEHPAYAIADYLVLDHASAAFKELQDVACEIMTHHGTGQSV